MSQQKMEEKWDKPRQICCDKDFNVAKNSSASDKDQRRKYVTTYSEFIATQSSVSTVQDNKTMSQQRKGLS